ILEKVNPFLKLCASKTVTLVNRGDEETAFRFTVDKEGEVSKVSHLKKVMVGPVMDDRNMGLNPREEEGEPNEDDFGGEPDE
ncbi:unnamed protein product, partial [marine sediment metagenome]